MPKLRSLLSKRNIVIALILLSIIVWRVFAYLNGGLKVELLEVQKENLIESVSASGEVSAEKIAYMYFPTSGKVAWLGVSEGDFVKKYQSLASLDKTTLDAVYQQSLNMVRKYGATVDNIHDQLKNKETTETYSERDTRTSAEATNDYYYNALRAAEYNLKNATLVAPFSGIVTSFAPGLAVGANYIGTSPAFSVVDPTTTYFLTKINEVDINKIKPETKVIITLDSYPEETFEGVIKSIDFSSVTTSTGGTAYKVKTSLPENINFRFRLGMNGDSEFIIAEKSEVLSIPQSAVSEIDGKYYVWTVSPGNKITKKEIKIGGSSIDNYEVLEGLSPNEKVVDRPTNKLKEGIKVKI